MAMLFARSLVLIALGFQSQNCPPANNTT
jgi:hypothetical protein